MFVMAFGGQAAPPRPPFKPDTANKLLLLGIGGTLIDGREEVSELSDHNSIQVFPGLADLLTVYRREGWLITMLSNQPNLSRGKLTRAELHLWFAALVGKLHNNVDLSIYCQHDPDSEKRELATCCCRKPKYGMLVLAQMTAEQLISVLFPLSEFLIVGGADEKLMAEAAGVRFKEAADWRAEAIAILGKLN